MYVLDTGIQSTHSAFRKNQVIHGFDAIDSPPIETDPNGHGTQVAGIILYLFISIYYQLFETILFLP